MSYKFGQDCRDLFRSAYDNRYTWDPGFSGYRGEFRLKKDNEIFKGSFTIGEDMKALLKCDNDTVNKIVSGQLWEIAIHRVRRSFEETHEKNTFTIGDENKVGLEIIVGGKNKGDRYRIKDNIITMVYRHIHGTIINIYTESTISTSSGYLSHKYNTQFIDSVSKKNINNKKFYVDTFEQINDNGPWLLNKRIIKTISPDSQTPSIETLEFLQLHTN